MTEFELVEAITEAARERSHLVHHCNDSRHCTGQRGFLDLLIVGNKNVLYAEIKGLGGQTTAEQDLWLWKLLRTGAMAVTWNQHHWLEGVIEQTLDVL